MSKFKISIKIKGNFSNITKYYVLNFIHYTYLLNLIH